MPSEPKSSPSGTAPEGRLPALRSQPLPRPAPPGDTRPAAPGATLLRPPSLRAPCKAARGRRARRGEPPPLPTRRNVRRNPRHSVPVLRARVAHCVRRASGGGGRCSHRLPDLPGLRGRRAALLPPSGRRSRQPADPHGVVCNSAGKRAVSGAAGGAGGALALAAGPGSRWEGLQLWPCQAAALAAPEFNLD